MGEYDHALPCVAAANIMMHSFPGTQTKEAMKCAGIKQVDIKYDTCIKRIKRLKKKIVASNLSQIVVRDGSNLPPSITTIGSRETGIFGAPPFQVVNLVTPRTAITKSSSVNIDTTSTIPRDTIIPKTSRRLQ